MVSRKLILIGEGKQYKFIGRIKFILWLDPIHGHQFRLVPFFS